MLNDHKLAENAQQQQLLSVARQGIELLRRWYAIATDALTDFQATRHPIGTQFVTFTALAFKHGSDAVASGTAEMTSYVQAWHAWPNRWMRLVIGNYHDRVRLQPGVGWQVERMVLTYDSGETRVPGDPP